MFQCREVGCNRMLWHHKIVSFGSKHIIMVIGRVTINQSHRLEYLSYSSSCPKGFILAHLFS